MKTKIIICGAMGRMGQRLVALVQEDKSLQLAGALESPRHPMSGQKISGDVSLCADLNQLANQAQVLIDFTTPAATLEHLKIVSEWKNFAAVIGTTGFSKEEQELIAQYSKKIPIVFSPNFSVGVNLLFDVVRKVAEKVPDYDIEIVEAHHNQKKDAPSGTALGLAREITDALHRSMDQDLVHGRFGEVGARPKKEIGMHAIRGGDIVGDHTVIFASAGERLELTHRASSRDAFASGALRAAAWVTQKPAGLYTMKDVLKKQ